MIKITPDGSVKEFALGVTPMDVAKSISEGFARNVFRLPLTVQQLNNLFDDGWQSYLTWNDENGKKLLAFDFTCHGKSLNKCILSQINTWTIF
jgi:threonyl-tRNA synthetase